MSFTEISERGWSAASGIDRVWLVIAIIFSALAILDPVQVGPSLRFTVNAVLHTLPYMALAVAAIGFLKATGAEKLVARAFQGKETRMIVLASLVGGLSPFCSCEIIPFIAALLAVGTPLSAVMALWLASPIMDPAIFVITSGELGWGFAVAKTLSAVCLGLFGGFAVRLAVRAGYFRDILLSPSSGSCGGGCGSSQPYAGKPVWAFWTDTDRLQTFWSEVRNNGFFLLKWLSLAYLFESLMLQYVPAEAIAGIVGGTGLQPILVSAFVGAPAYLNGYAAPAIVSGLIEQGMTAGAAMTFMVAGGVTSIPAMTAVFALVRRPVFAAYLGLGISGAILSGLAFSAYLVLS
ncbi:MAG: permease [Yoonia sp.]|uniref:permease n=1 Tax=Yoonia sp. TaxID=2212373 RepID=UPI003EF1E31A